MTVPSTIVDGNPTIFNASTFSDLGWMPLSHSGVSDGTELGGDPLAVETDVDAAMGQVQDGAGYPGDAQSERTYVGGEHMWSG